MGLLPILTQVLQPVVLMNILVAPDSFKGTLSAADICQHVQETLGPEFTVLSHPLADGGEGTLAAIADCLPDAQWIEQTVMGPLPQQRIKAHYLWFTATQTAFIEMAQASGLTLLTETERNPALTTTYGTGELIADALNRGAKKIDLAIGGSATNDAGVGMLMALGWQFLDSFGQPLSFGGNQLARIQRIVPPNPLPIAEQGVEVWCDVTNPLYGPKGAIAVFGPQKGANADMVRELDQGLQHFAQIVEQQFDLDLNFAGAGAAGGLGAGAKLGFNAQLSRGIERIAELTGLEAKIRASDVVITGEGYFDHQSLQGKVVSGVLALAQKYQKRLILLVGNTAFDAYPGIEKIMTLVTPQTSIQEALNNPQKVLKERCQELKSYLSPSRF